MKKKIKTICLILILILFQSCSDDPPVTQPINNYPMVKIISPKNAESLIDSTKIVVEALDDKGIVQVEIYINNKTDSSATLYVPPYEYMWKPPLKTDSTNYLIYAKGYDADGNIGTSNVILIYVRQFGPPSELRIESISPTEILLKWDDNSAIETGFEIERKIGNSPFKLIAIVDSNSTSYLDSGLGVMNEYTYRVRAVKNNTFTDYSANISMVYKYQFSLVNVKSGHGIGGTWGSLYTSVRISNDNLVYLYSYENTTFLLAEHFFDSTKFSAYGIFGDGSDGLIFDLKFNYSDNKFLLASNKKKIYSWTVFDSSVPLKEFPTTSDTIFSVSFSPINNTFASSEANGFISIWDYNSGSKLKSINSNVKGKTIVLLLPNGNMVTGDPNGRIKIWDLANGGILKNFVAHNNAITQLIYNDARGIIISSSMDGYIKIWDINSGNYLTGKWLHFGGVTDISMNTEGTKLITCGMDRRVRYFIYPQFNEVVSFSNTRLKDYLTASLSPDGKKLLVGGNRYVDFYADSSKWILK
jgi:WD40 repeat protein